MKNLLRALIAAKPVRTPLDFGLNDNVRILKISNEKRTNNDGEKINRNTYMVFGKFDEEGKKIATSEFSYYNLDHTGDHGFSNLTTQVAQLNEFVGILNPEASVDPTEGYSSIEELVDDTKSKKGCQKLMDRMWDQFSDAVEDHIGEDSELLRLKVVTNSKGTFKALPNDTLIVESMDLEETQMRISPWELKNRDKGLEPAKEKADKKGGAPSKSKDKSVLGGL